MIQVLLVLAITISISDSIKKVIKIGILSILFRQNEPKIFEIINKNENIKSAQYILFCKVGINLLLKKYTIKKITIIAEKNLIFYMPYHKLPSLLTFDFKYFNNIIYL